MKKLLMLITLFAGLYSTPAVASEVSRSYYWHGDFGYITVDLNESTKVYIIEYSYNISGDMVQAYVLSSGCFRYMSDNEMSFEDKVTGLTMKAIKIKDVALKFISGYGILNNKTYQLAEHYYGLAWPILKDKHSSVINKRTGLIQSDYSTSLTDGSWGYGRLCLTLKDDKFRYSIKDRIDYAAGSELKVTRYWYDIDIPILEGTWSQKGNLIILHDEHTEHDFYLIYEAPNLRTMLLPGDFNLEGTVLQRQ